MTKMKTLALTVVAGALTLEQTFAAIDPKKTADVDTGLRGNSKTDMVSVFQSFVNWTLGLLALVATAYGIYAGYLIVTAAGDEEKMKKGKHILMQVAIGIVIIFLAWTAVSWVISLAGGGATGGTGA